MFRFYFYRINLLTAFDCQSDVSVSDYVGHARSDLVGRPVRRNSNGQGTLLGGPGECRLSEQLVRVLPSMACTCMHGTATALKSSTHL